MLRRHPILSALTIITVVAVAIVAALHWYVHQSFIFRLQGAIKDNARIAGIDLEINRIDYNLLTGFRIHGISAKGKVGESISYSAKIPETRIDYGLKILPKPRAILIGGLLKSPELTVDIEEGVPTALRGGSKSLAKSVSEKILENVGRAISSTSTDRISCSDEMEIEWEDASATIIDSRDETEGSAFEVGIVKARGHLSLDAARNIVNIYTTGKLAPAYRTAAFYLKVDSKGWESALDLSDVTPDIFGHYLPKIIKHDPGTKIKTRLLVRSNSGGKSKFVADIDIENLVLEDDAIAEDAIIMKNTSISARGGISLDDENIEIETLDMKLGDLRITASGTAGLGKEPTLSLQVAINKTPIQSVLNSLPLHFIPNIRGAQVNGTIGITIDTEMDFANLKKLKLEPIIEIDEFEIVSLPKNVDVSKIKKPFMHKAVKDGKTVKKIWIGEKNEDFIPFEDLGENIKNAVLTCEDKGFFHHKGFLLNHIRDSIVQNIKDHKFTRGASTITMQTTKNLFLTGDKNFSRKFEEMLLSYALEQKIDKERTFEIYMNIIEWGPEIYGVSEASRYYFDKDQSELTPLEAAFLGSIIPSPKRYHKMVEDGFVTDSWSTYLAVILTKMGISAEEYENARPFSPEFAWVKKTDEEGLTVSGEAK